MIWFLYGLFFGIIIGGCLGAFLIALGIAAKKGDNCDRNS